MVSNIPIASSIKLCPRSKCLQALREKKDMDMCSCVYMDIQFGAKLGKNERFNLSLLVTEQRNDETKDRKYSFADSWMSSR